MTSFFFPANRLDLVAPLAEHWTSKPKVAGEDDFAIGYVRIYPGVNNRELRTSNLYSSALGASCIASVLWK